MLEICCADIESVRNAISGGANNILLCSALEVGGLTSSFAVLGRAIWLASRRETPIKVNVLIRPRSGDFFYSDRELDMIAEDAVYALEAGADGITFGALTAEGDVDDYACSKILDTISAASNPQRNFSVSFSRSFDFCKDPFSALKTIEAMGFGSVYTSGQAKTASAGLELIRQLNEKALSRLNIIAAGGIKPDNVNDIVAATGVAGVLTAASVIKDSRMEFRATPEENGISFDKVYSRRTASSKVVAELTQKMNSDFK